MTKDETESEPLYRALMRARVLGALKTARATAGISHSGVKGRVREILISELFRPLFPKDVSIASGLITDFKGRLSTQQDIIIFDGSIVPPISFDASAAIIPIEAVLYTIEVKSELTMQELRQAHKSAKELAAFTYLDHGQPNVLATSVLFALGSDLNSDPLNEAKRYVEVCGGEAPFLKEICVAGKGNWIEMHGGWTR